MSIGDSFLVRGESLCLPLPLSTGTCSVQALFCCRSLNSYGHQAWCIWETLFSWSHSYPLALPGFLPPLLHSYLSPEGRNLMKTSHLVVFQNPLLSAHWGRLIQTSTFCFGLIVLFYKKMPISIRLTKNRKLSLPLLKARKSMIKTLID